MTSPLKFCIYIFLLIILVSSPAGAMAGQAGGGGTSNLIEALRLSLVNNPLAVTSNSNPYVTLSFCQPVPTEYLNFQTSTPSSKNCGVYKFDLVNFPANNLPSGGTSNRISPSEMAFVYVKIDNYPGSGTIKMSWFKEDGTQMYSFSTPVSAKAVSSWTWWYWYAWSFVGHFDWEINTPGKYYLLVETTWGNSRIDFDVVDTTPPIDNSCKIGVYSTVTGTPSQIVTFNGDRTWGIDIHSEILPKRISIDTNQLYGYGFTCIPPAPKVTPTPSPTPTPTPTPTPSPTPTPTPSPTPTPPPAPGQPAIITPDLAKSFLGSLFNWLNSVVGL